MSTLNRVFRPSILSRLGSPSLLALILFGGNVWVCRELFQTEYLTYMGSIEGAYVGLSRWILNHPWDLDWFPLWYGGIPFPNAYPPLLHLLVALVAAAGKISPALSYHAVTAAMYCAGPATLFWLAWRLSADRATAFVAGLLYSFLSPSALLVREVADDLGGAFGPRRLHVLLAYGEGPHLASLALLPLAVLALDAALRRRRVRTVYAAMFGLAAVVLTNWLGAFALAAAVFAYLLSAGGHGGSRTVPAACGIGVLAYALAAPWIPPSTISAIGHNAQYTVGNYRLSGIHLLYGLLVLAAATVVALLLRRLRADPLMRFAAVFFLLMGVLSLGWYWVGVYLMPQPERYHLEMEMALALLLAASLVPAWRRLPVRYRAVTCASCVVLLVVQAGNFRSGARRLIQPTEIGQTLEYQVARWLDENLPGSRVYAQGSTRFWLNAFADNPQVGGGFDQGITNRLVPEVTFGVGFGKADAARSIVWLRCFGVDAVVVSGPNTRDAYRDFQDPDKFEGVLPVLWRDGDDVIYEVPGRRSLAHAVRAEQIVWRRPENYLDTEPLRVYYDALGDMSLPAAELEWRRPGEGMIRAELEAGQVLSVQVTWHPGWRAQVRGESRPIRSDGLGFIVIEPACEGPCSVALTYDGGPEMKLAKGASVAALGAPWLLLIRRRRS